VVIHAGLGSSEAHVGGYPCRSTKLGSARRWLSMSLYEARERTSVVIHVALRSSGPHVGGYPCRPTKLGTPRRWLSMPAYEAREPTWAAIHPPGPLEEPIPSSSAGRRLERSDRMGRRPETLLGSPKKRVSTTSTPCAPWPRQSSQHPGIPSRGSGRVLSRARAPNVRPPSVPSPHLGRAKRTNKHGFSLTRRVAC
jgi:hypothetical protein